MTLRNLFAARSGKEKSAVSLDSIDFKGWLYKEGEHNRDFRRRFFALSGQHLAYFKDEADVARGNSKGEFTVEALGDWQRV